MGRRHATRSCRIVAVLLASIVLPACSTQTDFPAGALAVDRETPVASRETLPPQAGLSTSSEVSAPPAAYAAEGPSNHRVPGQSEGKMTLEGAVQRAVSWHPAIDEAVGRLNRSSAEINVARAGYYPQVNGGIDSSYSRDDDGDGWQPRINVSASQMVYDFGKVSGSVDARRAGEAVSRAELLLAVDTLIRDTAYAVVEVQRNRALRKVAQEQFDGVRAIADLVQQRSDKGASTKSDQVQASARVEAARSTLLQIETELSRWESDLASLIGTSSLAMLSSDVPAWLMKACDVGQPDWSQVPAMLQAEARKKEAEALLARSRAESLPTLSLEAGAGYDLVRSSSRRSDIDPDEPDFTVGLKVSSSLYEGGAAGARRDAASYALRAADAARDNARFQVTRDLMAARGQIGDLSRLQASLSSRGGMMEETRDLYRQQYFELGTRTLLDLLNAEQELHTTEFDRVNTAHDLRRLGTDCLFNSGQTRTAFALGGTTVRGVSLSP